MPERTFIDLFNERARTTPDRLALSYCSSGRWESCSWAEFGRLTDQVADGLLSLGIAAGDRVAILSRSRAEWVLADFGILKAGAVTVPVHAEAHLEEVCHELSDSGATVVFVEDEKQLAKVRQLEGRTEIRHILVILGPAQEPKEITWDNFLAAGRVHQAEFPTARDARIKALKASDLASVVYTSGTTGKPKGAMLTHENFVFEAESLAEVMRGFIGPEDLHLMCLPLAHILPRGMILAAIPVGYCTAFSCGLDVFERELLEVRPTFVTVVPAILERIHAVFQRELQKKGRLARGLFGWARGVGNQVARRRQGLEPLPLYLKAREMVASGLVLGPMVRDRFGGRLKFFISGGAPLSAEIAEFLQSLGLLVLEGYGLTENVGAANVNRPDRFRFGTVGPPIPGIEERLAADGEILLRGRNVMVGYWGQPDASAEVLDADGWLHTGDIGLFEGDGFLRVTDRKKDIIVTASGKNVSPQNIETLLRSSPFIDQVVVLGDGRNYLTALVSLDAEQLQRFAEEQGIAFDKISELVYHPRVRQLVAAQIEDRNRQLAGHEAIRRFTILPEPLSLDAGEITPTLKVRRREVEERYRDLIEGMYAGSAEAAQAL